MVLDPLEDAERRGGEGPRTPARGAGRPQQVDRAEPCEHPGIERTGGEVVMHDEGRPGARCPDRAQEANNLWGIPVAEDRVDHGAGTGLGRRLSRDPDGLLAEQSPLDDATGRNCAQSPWRGCVEQGSRSDRPVPAQRHHGQEETRRRRACRPRPHPEALGNLAPKQALDARQSPRVDSKLREVGPLDPLQGPIDRRGLPGFRKGPPVEESQARQRARLQGLPRRPPICRIAMDRAVSCCSAANRDDKPRGLLRIVISGSGRISIVPCSLSRDHRS